MKFFKTIRDSIYNPAFYKSLPATQTNSAISYFLKLIIILAVLQTILLALPTFGAVTELKNKVLPKLISSYPANLTVTIKNGQASINQPEPYIVPIPPSAESTSQNLIVIDTKTPYSSEEFKNFSTLALLTKNAIYYQQESTGEIRSMSLIKVGDVRLNRQFLNEQLNKYSPLLKFATPLILLLILVFLFLLYLIKLLYNLFLAIVIWVISRVLDLKLTFGQSYRIGLHAMTLGLIIEVLLRVASPLIHFPGFPFMFTIISAAVFVINFKTEKEK